jgi:hypothetical protein
MIVQQQASNHASAPLSAALQQTALERLQVQLEVMPLWLKQVLFIQLKEDLEGALSPDTMSLFTSKSVVQCWKPQLTRAGLQQAHNTQGNSLPQAVVHCLALAQQNMSVMNMALSSQWTLQQTCLVLNRAIEQDLVERPQLTLLDATVQYLAGDIRLGEYLVALGKLSPAQLEEAMMTQRYIKDALGEHVLLGDVLIRLGLVSKQDSEAILFLKQACDKPYTLANGLPVAEAAHRHAAPIHKAQQQEAPQPATGATTQTQPAASVAFPQQGTNNASSLTPLSGALPPAFNAGSGTLQLPPPPVRLKEEKVNYREMFRKQDA